MKSELMRAAAMLLTTATLLTTSIGLGAVTGSDLGRAALSMKRLEKRWGVEVVGVRLSGNGRLVDFRYKVLDPEKAGNLGDREVKPFLIDQASGATLLVPKTPKVGPLRQTGLKPEPGKVYFMLFANPACLVKVGSKVTLTVGDFHLDNLIVE